MKISAFLLLVSIFPVIASNAYSQETEIAFKQKSITLETVIQKIEASTNYRFLYRTEQINMQQKVNVSDVKTPVLDILSDISRSNNFTFKVLDHNLIVLSPNSVAAKFKVSGTIVSTKNLETLIGVSVREKGTSNATVTDINGAFSLLVLSPNAILEVSYVGYIKQEIAVDNKSQLTIRLVEDVKTLDEVVVVGYGTQKRVTVVGAITSITTKELRQSPTTNLSNALAGRLPGMLVNQFSGGEPGVDQSQVFVRGMSTYNTGNNSQNPIVIVDGIERDFQYLNPDEVETFSILKDASATAVYGIRGANGVILVTTRRGKEMEKARVSFKASTGISSPIKFPQYLGSADYATLYNEALSNNPTNTAALFTPAAIANYRIAKGDNSDGLGYNMNLFDYAFKPSMQQDYSMNIQGGSKTTKYFVLVGYMNQNGNYQHTNDGPLNTNAVFKRYNFRSNIDINITDDFYVKLNLGGRIQNRIAPGTTASRLITIANTQPSIYPIINEKNDNPANAVYQAKHPEGLLFGSALYRYNMLGELAYSGSINEYKTFMDGSFIMGHKLDFITKGLTIEGQFSYDIQAGNTVDRTIPHESGGSYREYGGYATFFPAVGVDVLMNGGHYTGAYASPRRTDNNTMNNNFDARTPQPQRKNDAQMTLNYTRSFGLHNFSALLLARQSVRQYQNDIAFATQGTSFRTTYNYAEKYLIEVNAAYNGSENFAKGHKYGLFPAAALGWVVSNEAFLKKNPVINYLKIRGSYGLVGSDVLPGNRFGYLQFFTVNGDTYNFGTTQNSSAPANVYEGGLANPALTWEKSKKTDIGIEARLLKNKLSITADVFYEHRYDILTQPGGDVKNVSAVVGQSAPQLNIGIVDNKGIDLEIGWNDNIGKDFNYYIKPNLSFARNKIDRKSVV